MNARSVTFGGVLHAFASIWFGFFVVYVILLAVGAPAWWIEVPGWLTLFFLARPDTNVGGGALALIVFTGLISIPELVVSVVNDDWRTAGFDVAYLALWWWFHDDVVECVHNIRTPEGTP